MAFILYFLHLPLTMPCHYFNIPLLNSSKSKAAPRGAALPLWEYMRVISCLTLRHLICIICLLHYAYIRGSGIHTELDYIFFRNFFTQLFLRILRVTKNTHTPSPIRSSASIPTMIHTQPYSSFTEHSVISTVSPPASMRAFSVDT